MSVNDSVVRNVHGILLQIADIQGQLDRGPRQVKASQMQVEAARDALAKCREEIKQKKMEADRKQLQLREREAKIRDWEAKMNSAKKNNEFQAIKEQIAADSQANSVLSDEILEALEAVDALNVTSKELDARLKLAESDSAKMVSQIQQRLETLKSELERVRNNLAEAQSELPEDILSLITSRKEEAMAELDDKSCGGCNTGLPPKILDRLRMGVPSTCSSCGRLIYRPEK